MPFLTNDFAARDSKQYFTCPPNCGVFVATTKLSAPTVGVGAIHRPSSVASSRGGRATPSTSTSMQCGRATPSGSNGRVTPSFGRITPGTTPSSSRMRAFSRSTVKTPTISSQRKSYGLEHKITDGSRASKYLNMTAKQLNSRDSAPSQGSASPSRSNPSPTRASLGFSSPIRPLPSPYRTPKAGGRVSNIGVGMPPISPSKGRLSLITPRARIPSAVAMPPPASPASTSRSVSLNGGSSRALSGETARTAAGDNYLSDLEVNGKTLQDKIALLMSGNNNTPSPTKASSRPPSATSIQSAAHVVDLQTQIERLQSRVASLEYENQRLREAANDTKADELQAASGRIELLQATHEESMTRISELETHIKTSERSLNERNSKVEFLERIIQQTLADLDRQRNESETRLKELQAKLEDSDAMVKNLKEAIEAKEGLENQNDSVLKAKNAEIILLESRIQKTSADWEQDRKELAGQVDELRQAGQVS